MAAVTIPLRIENPRGFHLAADLLLPSGVGPFPAVVFTRDLRESADSPRNRLTAGMLAREGIAVMLLDFTGQGDSEGAVEDSTVEQQVEDVGVALDELERRPNLDMGRVGAYGSGAGALAVALRGERDLRIRALVLRDPRSEGVFDAIRRVPLPTLMIVGSEDRGALEEALALQETLAGEKRVMVVPGVDSDQEDPARLQEVAILTVDWFREHL